MIGWMAESEKKIEWVDVGQEIMGWDDDDEE